MVIGLYGAVNLFHRDDDPGRGHRDRSVDDDPRVDAVAGPAVMGHGPSRRVHDQVVSDGWHAEIVSQLAAGIRRCRAR